MTDQKKRGGVRPGSGRPKNPNREPMAPLSAIVPEKIKMRIEYESKRRGITVSKYVSDALKEKIDFDQEIDKIHTREAEHDE